MSISYIPVHGENIADIFANLPSALNGVTISSRGNSVRDEPLEESESMENSDCLLKLTTRVTRRVHTKRTVVKYTSKNRELDLDELQEDYLALDMKYLYSHLAEARDFTGHNSAADSTCYLATRLLLQDALSMYDQLTETGNKIEKLMTDTFSELNSIRKDTIYDEVRCLQKQMTDVYTEIKKEEERVEGLKHSSRDLNAVQGTLLSYEQRMNCNESNITEIDSHIQSSFFQLERLSSQEAINKKLATAHDSLKNHLDEIENKIMDISLKKASSNEVPRIVKEVLDSKLSSIYGELNEFIALWELEKRMLGAVTSQSGECTTKDRVKLLHETPAFQDLIKQLNSKAVGVSYRVGAAHRNVRKGCANITKISNEHSEEEIDHAITSNKAMKMHDTETTFSHSEAKNTSQNTASVDSNVHISATANTNSHTTTLNSKTHVSEGSSALSVNQLTQSLHSSLDARTSQLRGANSDDEKETELRLTAVCNNNLVQKSVATDEQHRLSNTASGSQESHNAQNGNVESKPLPNEDITEKVGAVPEDYSSHISSGDESEHIARSLAIADTAQEKKCTYHHVANSVTAIKSDVGSSVTSQFATDHCVLQNGTLQYAGHLEAARSKINVNQQSSFSFHNMGVTAQTAQHVSMQSHQHHSYYTSTNTTAGNQHTEESNDYISPLKGLHTSNFAVTQHTQNRTGSTLQFYRDTHQQSRAENFSSKTSGFPDHNTMKAHTQHNVAGFNVVEMDAAKRAEPSNRVVNVDLGISVKTHPQGVIVRQVHPKSVAGAAGIKVDDVIFAVNAEPVKDAPDLLHVLHSSIRQAHENHVKRVPIILSLVAKSGRSNPDIIIYIQF